MPSPAPSTSPITSRANARVKALRAALDGRASAPGEVVAVEGVTLIAEALRSGLALDTVFVRQGSESALAALPLRATRIVTLSPEVFASAVDTTAPQGIAATFAIPRPQFFVKSCPASSPPQPSLTLVLESIQDPGNVGTMLRAAEAFGATQVIALGSTANAWGPKALRASAGSVFRLPVQHMSLHELSALQRDRGLRLFAAVAESRAAVACMAADFTQPCALLIGNEGAGLSAAALAIADERVHIPCLIESLNAAAAAATLLYEAMRQRFTSRVSSVGASTDTAGTAPRQSVASIRGDSHP